MHCSVVWTTKGLDDIVNIHDTKYTRVRATLDRMTLLDFFSDNPTLCRDTCGRDWRKPTVKKKIAQHLQLGIGG